MPAQTPFYPLLFEDLYKEKLWGGRRLETVLGRALPAELVIGESWEVSDRAPDTSVVANGPLRGTTLHELVLDRPEELLGPGFDLGRFQRFPLLVKFIDANQVLSVQVHPPDDFAREHDPHDDGKTEMLHVLGTEGEAVLYLGLRPGVGRSEFEEAVKAGGVGEVLRPVRVQPGDSVFLPPGTLHAYGAGVLLAEVQQNSDLTYRVYDWGRVGADGNPRPLHLEKALAVIGWDAPRQEKLTPELLADGAVRKERLVRSPKFTVERWTLREPVTQPLAGRFHILMALTSRVEMIGPAGGPAALERGHSALLPAAVGQVELRPRGEAVLLVTYREGEGD